jgi:Co/Zn/Cd efflux system component
MDGLGEIQFPGTAGCDATVDHRVGCTGGQPFLRIHPCSGSRSPRSLTRAAFLSARNDALANVAIIAAGFVTAITPSVWPDLIVGGGIFVMNLDASRQVYGTAREERRATLAEP